MSVVILVDYTGDYCEIDPKLAPNVTSLLMDSLSIQQLLSMNFNNDLLNLQIIVSASNINRVGTLACKATNNYVNIILTIFVQVNKYHHER